MTSRTAVLLVALAAARVAHADAPAAAVDVSDLPPLPATSEGVSSSATVLAAAAAEEDVVVGAAKRQQSLGSVASAVTVISGDRIRRFGYRTVGEALAAVAGAYLVDNRLSYSIGIRGLNLPGDYNTRILVLVDGASVNEGWASFAGIGFDSFVSIDDIERIELIRGPVSSVYGANAFFGIINIVTRNAAEQARAWGRVGVSSINGVVSRAGFALGDLHRQLRGTFQTMQRFGETTSVDGVGNDLRGDGSSQYALGLVGTYKGSFGQIRAYRFHRDSPFAPYNGDPTVDTPYRAYDNQLLVELGHTHELSKDLTITARGYANIYRYTDHIVQIGMPAFDDIGDGQAYGVELRGRYAILPHDRLGLTAGTEASYYKTDSTSYTEGDMACASPANPDGAACVPKSFNIEGVYGELDSQPTSWLGATAGLRFDNNSVIDQRLSPRLALFLSKRERYGLKLLYAQGFRNPSAYEAFFYDNVSFAAPDHLRAETIASYEAVAWAKPVPGLSTRLSAFYWDARDVAEQVPVTLMNGMALLQFQNVGRFVSQGLEAEASYRDAHGWYGFAGASFQDVGCAAPTAPDLATSAATCGAGVAPGSRVVFGKVPNAPAVTASGGISSPTLFGLAHVSTELTFIGRRATRPDVDSGTENAASPAWLGWNWAIYAPNIHGFDLTLGVRNLLGTRDLVPAPGDYDRLDADGTTTTITQVPGEGREIYVKVGASY